MYANQDSIEKNILYQGDIINDFPFFIFQNSQLVQKNLAGFFEKKISNGDEEENLYVIASKKQDIMILSQSCDIQRRENVIICPVYKFQDLIDNGAITAKQAESLRGRKIYYNFYLPGLGSFPESIADFQTMVYVSRENLMSHIGSRSVSLDHLGRHHLAWALTNYFGRPIETT